MPVIGSVTVSSIRVYRYKDDTKDLFLLSLFHPSPVGTDTDTHTTTTKIVRKTSRRLIAAKHVLSIFSLQPRNLYILPDCNISAFRVACLYLWIIIFNFVPDFFERLSQPAINIDGRLINRYYTGSVFLARDTLTERKLA